jgi:hypothetical protein
MRVLSIAFMTVMVLLVAVLPARSQSIPSLNVKPVCRGIAQQALDPSEAGGPDLAFAACVKSEQEMREKLAGEMVDIFAIGKDQLHRRANGRNGKLYRSHQLPGNGERRAGA